MVYSNRYMLIKTIMGTNIKRGLKWADASHAGKNYRRALILFRPPFAGPVTVAFPAPTESDRDFTAYALRIDIFVLILYYSGAAVP